MRYYFKVLILGRDLDLIHFYASIVFGEPGEDKGTYFEWYKEINIFEDTCNLEIDAITDITADLDDIIPTVDGIIYFLNPLIKEDYELFEMVIPDIFSVKRDIPTIIIFYDQNGILPISINDLLVNIWVNYPSLEAFANLNPSEFNQALQALGVAMRNVETPLNIENAWMRFPIFIQMANIYFKNKNYYYAAQAVRKAALIAEIYGKEEYYIISDQAAYLYSKINLYLEASQILEKIDKKKSKNFKNLYAEAMIREGNISFNKGEYEAAAKQYERAGQWTSIESLNKEIVDEAFKLAINSWISACKIENAFRILDGLSHIESLAIMKEITGKIGEAATYLIRHKNFELAREQLYIAIDKYQREALSEELEDLTFWQTENLVKYMKQQVDVQEIHAAKFTYDEIENMWESYNVKKTDLDSTLKKLINSFLGKNNFRMASDIINKLNSLMIKQDLTKLSFEIEEEYKASIKEELQAVIQKGVEILNEFVEIELDLIAEMNKEKIQEADVFIKEEKYLKAAEHLKGQANYLRKIGKEGIRDQILTKSLDILLEGSIFEEFFITFNNLSIGSKKNYIIRIYPIYIDKLRNMEVLKDFKQISKILDESIRIYRNHLLYNESKEISVLYIKYIKHEALSLLESEPDLLGIRDANTLVKKAINISTAYLEKEERVNINFDKIYRKIANFYIKQGDLPSAHAYNDRIKKAEYKAEIHKKIDTLETEESANRIKKVEESRRGEVLIERLSIIQTKAREAQLDKQKELRERTSLKRAYFKMALDYLEGNKLDHAINLYTRNVRVLNARKNYNLAGVSLAIVSLLLIKEDKFDAIEIFLEEIKSELAGLRDLFSETFPVTLVEYIIDVKKYQNEQQFKDAVSYMKFLPIFEEELKILHEFLGEAYRREEETDSHSITAEDSEEARLSHPKEIEIDQNYEKLRSKLGELRIEREEILRGRRALRRMVYGKIFSSLKNQDFKELATKYYDLTEVMIKRQDFNISALLFLLYGLSLLKAKNTAGNVNRSVTTFLDSLGVNKNLVKDTYYVMLIIFLTDVSRYNLKKYFKTSKKIQKLLDVLPLFDEEKQLIDLDQFK
ncbi:MAG: hypothetical protein ACW97V_05210 [Promethearchaeota archaeon]|jgi:hypothetical protein